MWFFSPAREPRQWKKLNTFDHTFKEIILWVIMVVWTGIGGMKKTRFSPGWYGLVDWVPACIPKGHQFSSRAGHMPGLRARSPAGGVWEATDRCISHTSMFLSLSFSLPFCLSKISKILKKRKENQIQVVSTWLEEWLSLGGEEGQWVKEDVTFLTWAHAMENTPCGVRRW